jgi:hypothetical protein
MRRAHKGVYARLRGLCETHRRRMMGFANALPIRNANRETRTANTQFVSFDFLNPLIWVVGSSGDCVAG